MAASHGSTVSGANSTISRERILALSQSYLLDNQARGHSARTLDQARWVLEKLAWWLETFQHDSLSSDTLRGWLTYVRTAHTRPEGRWGQPGAVWEPRRGNQAARTPASSRSLKNYWGILRTWLRWCVEQGEIETSPLDRIKPPIHRADEIEPMSEEQCRSLIEASFKRDNPTRWRDKAILLLMLDTGLRASEVCSLKVGDIDSAQRRAVVSGKGNKSRAVWWSAETNRALLDYLRRREAHEATSPLFTSASSRADGSPLTRGGLGQIIARIAEAAHVEDCHPHLLRHTYAVMFLRAGGQQVALKESLGHTSMEMTARYVRFAAADRAAAARLFSPVARLGK